MPRLRPRKHDSLASIHRMTDALLIVNAFLLAVLILLAALLLLRQRAASGDAATGEQLRTLLRASEESVRRNIEDDLSRTRTEIGGHVTSQTASLASALERRLTASAAESSRTRDAIDQQFAAIRLDNERKLEQIRQTVEEKLQGTLETRLDHSFRQVSERLEMVHKGLGEMQSLAASVSDLKRVFHNVKTKGTWGEVQLGALLEQVLTPSQYDRNVATTDTNDRVEFAIRLPGRDNGDPVWLPVDSKFPHEPYMQLADAAERGDPEGIAQAGNAFEAALKLGAKTLSSKYLAPPRTTDFGIMFLATEAIYAEALRRPALAESLQRDYRVVLSGPSTFAALLNSLQMGFRTLAIEKRSSEVWELLSVVKTEFVKYGEALRRAKDKLTDATRSLDRAESQTAKIRDRLEAVETMPEADPVLPLFAEPAGDDRTAGPGGLKRVR